MNAMVDLTWEGSVCILGLNHPERHNSLTPQFLNQILKALTRIQGEPRTRAVVLQAEGRSFSTGGDLEGFRQHLDSITAYAGEVVGLLNQVILGIVDLPFPVVVAVHGLVTGGSLGLVLAADIVLVSPQATFTPYYPVVGFSPDGGWTAMLPEIIGAKRTAEVLLMNHSITADEALAWGLANRIVPGEEIHKTALEIAEVISNMHPDSVHSIKRLLSAGKAELANRLEMERLEFIKQINKSETRNRMLAFLEKMKS